MSFLIQKFYPLIQLRNQFSGLHNYKVKIKHPYFRKKGFWEWRRKIIHSINKKRYIKRFLVPKNVDSAEKPIKGDSDNSWTFTVENIPIKPKILKNYCRLISNLHVQDALDWLAALPKITTNMILNSISKSRAKVVDEYNGDASNFIINYKAPIKKIKIGWGGGYRLSKTPRTNLVYNIREMSMEEFYHKIFILGNIPRSLGAELRSHINQKRVPLSNVIEWYPYLTSHTRYYFRRHLRFLNNIHQFDYYAHRREWIAKYNENLQRRKNLLREEYGLKPLET